MSMNYPMRLFALACGLCVAVVLSSCGDLTGDLIDWNNGDGNHDGRPAANLMKALYFDGNGDYVLVPNSRDLQIHPNGSFTVDAWVRSDKWGRWNWVATHATSNANNDFLFGFDAGRIRFTTCDLANDLFGQTRLETERWYHVAGVQNVEEGTMRIYLDGRLEGQLRLSGRPETTTGDLFIGARESYGTGRAVEFFNGVLHNVRIWRHAFSGEQIRDLMKLRRNDDEDVDDEPLLIAGDYERMIAHWPLNEGRGTIAHDVSGNGHNGRIYDAKWVQVAGPRP